MSIAAIAANIGQPDGAFLGIEGVRQPGVRRPGPPQRAEQQQAPQETVPGRISREEPGDLRDGEDEDEVEEQLEWRDPLVALDRANVHPGQPSGWAAASDMRQDDRSMPHTAFGSAR